MFWASSTRDAVWQPANKAAALTNASVRASVRDFCIDLFLVASIENEAVFALIAGRRRRIAGRAVDAIEAAEQDGGRIRGVGEAVIRPREILPRHRARDVGRHDHHQLGLA